MSYFAIMVSVVRRAADTWDDQAETMRAGRKRLTDANGAVASLGDRAGPAATAYLSTWLNSVDGLAGAAQGHGDGLRSFTTAVQHLDQDAADDLRALLPWENQDAVQHVPDGETPGFPTDDPGPAPDPDGDR